MTWFKVDDAFHSHPKILATPPAALGLWVVAGSWSSSHQTGGFVPTSILPRLLPDAATLADSLVTAGLWSRTRQRGQPGYQFHDWGTYNPTANEAKELHQKKAAAGRLGGLASAKARSKPQAPASHLLDHLLEPPTRPDPYKNGSVVTGTERRYPQPWKPRFDDGQNQNGAASRHPSAVPVAEAMRRANHPEEP